MPCRCDYMDPTQRELETRLVCQLLIYIQSTHIFDIDLSKNVLEGAHHSYGRSDVNDVDELTAQLCDLCQRMENNLIGRKVLYDGYNRDSRRLADWWQNHQEMDRQREEKTKKEQNNKKLRKQALAKLTKEERKALLG
jgi:cell division protein FtsB